MGHLLVSSVSLIVVGSNVHDPRALAVILERAEAQLSRDKHPDPYIRESTDLSLNSWLIHSAAPMMANGTKWYVTLSTDCLRS